MRLSDDVPRKSSEPISRFATKRMVHMSGLFDDVDDVVSPFVAEAPKAPVTLINPKPEVAKEAEESVPETVKAAAPVEGAVAQRERSVTQPFGTPEVTFAPIVPAVEAEQPKVEPQAEDAIEDEDEANPVEEALMMKEEPSIIVDREALAVVLPEAASPEAPPAKARAADARAEEGAPTVSREIVGLPAVAVKVPRVAVKVAQPVVATITTEAVAVVGRTPLYRRCGKCGHPTPPVGRFCGSCAAPLPTK